MWGVRVYVAQTLTRTLREKIVRNCENVTNSENGCASEKRDRDTAIRRIRWGSPKSGTKRRPNGENGENGWKSGKRDRDTARRRIRWESPKSGRKRRPNGQNVENGENGRKRVHVGKT